MTTTPDLAAEARAQLETLLDLAATAQTEETRAVIHAAILAGMSIVTGAIVEAIEAALLGQPFPEHLDFERDRRS